MYYTVSVLLGLSKETVKPRVVSVTENGQHSTILPIAENSNGALESPDETKAPHLGVLGYVR